MIDKTANVLTTAAAAAAAAAGVPAIYPPSMQYQPFYQYYSVPMVSYYVYIYIQQTNEIIYYSNIRLDIERWAEEGRNGWTGGMVGRLD